MLNDPKLLIAQIATKLGCHRGSLYRFERFMVVFNGLKPHSGWSVRRGMKDRETGELTAIDNDEDLEDKDD